MGKRIKLKPDSHAAKRKKKMEKMMEELEDKAIAGAATAGAGIHGKIFDEQDGK
jgi:CRISPR/Cas system CSM-associated protein Csm4 (group 5 of RAMP superfamily)